MGYVKNIPATNDPTAPPMAMQDPIHEASSSVIAKPNVGSLNLDINVAGKPMLQPHPKVDAAAANVAII